MTSELERLAFPYKRTAPAGCCELCHRTAELLSPITVDEARYVDVTTNDGQRRRWRLRRVIFACSRHADGNGPPITTPNRSMLRGTTTLRPQRECLFDDLAFKRGSVADRDRVLAA